MPLRIVVAAFVFLTDAERHVFRRRPRFAAIMPAMMIAIAAICSGAILAIPIAAEAIAAITGVRYWYVDTSSLPISRLAGATKKYAKYVGPRSMNISSAQGVAPACPANSGASATLGVNNSAGIAANRNVQRKVVVDRYLRLGSCITIR